MKNAPLRQSSNQSMTLDKADCVQIMEMYQEIKLLCLLRDMGIIDEEEFRSILQIAEASAGRKVCCNP